MAGQKQNGRTVTLTEALRQTLNPDVTGLECAPAHRHVNSVTFSLRFFDGSRAYSGRSTVSQRSRRDGCQSKALSSWGSGWST
jgi:hypothetical protein